MKWLVGFAVLGLSIASAKSFNITVDKPEMAGTLQLQPGNYKVTVDGSKVRFTNTDNGKTVETAGRIEQNTGSKFAVTSVDTHNVQGADQIQEIDLGGTNTKVVFNK